MSEFWVFLEIGLKHILSFKSYDHVLFLIALTVPFTFKDWARVLLLITVFTIGHSLSLVLSVFQILTFKVSLVEFLIPITILITALYNLFTAGKTSKGNKSHTVVLVTLFFGIIHGLGFSSYFGALLPGNSASKLLPLLEFALGIETAQLLTVLSILLLSYIFQSLLRFSKRDFVLVFSAFVIGVVLPIILGNPILIAAVK